jgi:hypothetical protein
MFKPVRAFLKICSNPKLCRVASSCVSCGIQRTSNKRRDSQLQDTQVDTRVQPQPALVRPQSRVVLNPVPPVDLELPTVVLPSDSELDDTFGDLDDIQGPTVVWVLGEEGFLRGVEVVRYGERGERGGRTYESGSYFVKSLFEFWFRSEV